MSAPQFFVGRLVPGERVALSPPDARHAVGSLRLRVGDEVPLADGGGTVGAGVLVRAEEGRAELDVGAVRVVARPARTVSVALAAPRGDRLGWVVQKLAELGVDEVVLMHSERSVRRWDATRAPSALERLRAVAREAAMQSRRPFITELSGPRTLDEAVDAEPARAVVLWERPGEALGGVLERDPRGVRLVVGPEGGFTEREIRSAVAGGAVTASLGPGVLRTETAALAASVIALERVGRLGDVPEARHL